MFKRAFQTLILVVALGVFSNSLFSQDKEAKLIQFNNFTANFEVPQGKTWVIHQIFSGFAAEIKTDANGSSQVIPVRIYIKTLNGDIKTDWQGNRFGPQVYQSNNTAATIAYPIVLPEGTKFSLVLIQGDPGNCSAYNGSGYISFFEVKNN